MATIINDSTVIRCSGSLKVARV